MSELRNELSDLKFKHQQLQDNVKPVLDIGEDSPNFIVGIAKKLFQTDQFFKEIMSVESRLKETCVN